MSFVDRMKARLEGRREALRAEARDIDHTLREPDSPDVEERALENEGDEVLEGLGNSAIEEIVEIDAALQRIELGTYGTCTLCGDDIVKARLEAVPQAALCVKCAS